MFPMFQVTYAHELMNDAHEYEMQVQLGKNNTRVLQHMTPTSATRNYIDLPPPPWLASLSPRLHLPPDLDT